MDKAIPALGYTTQKNQGKFTHEGIGLLGLTFGMLAKLDLSLKQGLNHRFFLCVG